MKTENGIFNIRNFKKMITMIQMDLNTLDRDQISLKNGLNGDGSIKLLQQKVKGVVYAELKSSIKRRKPKKL